MELKTARFTVLLDPAKKQAFEELCARQDLTPSQVVRKLIRDYLAAHAVTFIPGGLETGGKGEPGLAARGRRTVSSKSSGQKPRKPARKQ